jgi:hypothetical protein
VHRTLDQRRATPLQAELDLEFVASVDFLNGLRLLPEYGLWFDIRGVSAAFETDAMVLACPESQCILDHLGKPTFATARWIPGAVSSRSSPVWLTSRAR